jgi:hypothetical protein
MGRTSTRRTDAAALPATFPTPAGAVTAAPATAGPDSAVPTQRGRRPVEAPAARGSLLHAPAAEVPSVCPQCAGTSVTRLQMTLPDGGPATFVSCHDCETKGWFAADGAALPLAAVLGGAARR